MTTNTIRGNRVRLLFQGAVIVAVAAALGVGLQRWEAIGSSVLGRVDDLIPIPLVLTVVVSVGVALAFVIVKDSWNHRIDLGSAEITVTTGRGTFRIPYDRIAEVKKIPTYGVGLVVREFDDWIAQQPDAPPTLAQEAVVVRGPWGVDIGILSKNLDVGPDRFVALVKERLSA